MKRHRLEVADVLRAHGAAFLARGVCSSEQRRVLRNVSLCRTAALGGHKLKCQRCGHEEISYNSCSDRHCPKCQGRARESWLQARAADLLDVGYFHVTFTLPRELGPLALQNKTTLYGILFRAASETLQTLARDPKHLGAEIGFVAVLHTWGQNLHHHPHIHCLIPGGGISPDGKRWVSSKRKDFFIHVRVLSSLFRKKFLAFLREAFSSGKLSFHGKLEHLARRPDWEAFLGQLDGRDWIVDARPPFGEPVQVLKYLARYVHRVAISNQRLLSLRDGKVTFSWKNYAREGRVEKMTLEAGEFIRRFLQHVVPKGFQRIRHYGFLANRVRNKKLELCRELLRQSEETQLDDIDEKDSCPISETAEAPSADERHSCPVCKSPNMILLEKLTPDPTFLERVFPSLIPNTS